jgi:heme/copper-type cytochrome/quinol oxidase subunit 2
MSPVGRRSTMQTMAALVAAESSNAVNVLVMLSVIVPVIVVIALPFVFFRAARRNDEREALAKQQAEGRPNDA